MTRALTAEVKSGLAKANKDAAAFPPSSIEDGSWLLALLTRVLKAALREESAASLARRYPGVAPDDVVDKLISETAMTTSVAAVVAAAGVDAAVLTGLVCGGATVPAGAAAALGEIMYTTKAQIRLVVNIAVAYGRELREDDPGAALQVLSLALGIEGGRRLKGALGGLSKLALNELGAQVGKAAVKEGIKKYAVPAANIVIGGGVNWITTRAIGAHAREMFLPPPSMIQGLVDAGEAVDRAAEAFKKRKTIFDP